MHKTRGFTLLELMIVVVVISVLAAIALPSYQDYVLRGKFNEATGHLANLRVKMEQYYMDNRRYSSTTAGGTCGITGGNSPTVGDARYFTYTCASAGTTAAGDQTFVLTASGVATEGLTGIAFTINESNTKATTITAASVMANKGYSANAGCWIRKKPSQC